VLNRAWHSAVGVGGDGGMSHMWQVRVNENDIFFDKYLSCQSTFQNISPLEYSLSSRQSFEASRHPASSSVESVCELG
jgi:hypothetical protein